MVVLSGISLKLFAIIYLTGTRTMLIWYPAELLWLPANAKFKMYFLT